MRAEKKIVIGVLVCIGFFALKKLITDKLEGLSSDVEIETEGQIDENKMTAEEICDYISQN